MDISEILKKLSDSFGVSSWEHNTYSIVEETLKEMDSNIEISKRGTGSLVAKYGNGDKKIAFFAHIDEIGIAVSKIVDKDFARVEMVGGVDPRTLIAKRVMFKTENGDKLGVIGMLAPHLQDKDKRGQSPSFDELFIDFSISGGTDDINVGDIGVVESKSKELKNKNISGKAIDNRAGVVSIIKALEYLKKFKFDGTLYLSFNKGEEVGLVGAKGMAYDIHPDNAIIVDVTFAEDLPSNMETMKIGKGPAIGIGAAINKEVYKKLKDIAKNENIDHQIEVLPMRTGTETDVVQLVKTGVKTGVLSIPIYNMHSPVEVVNEKDIDLTAKLLALYAYEEGEKKWENI